MYSGFGGRTVVTVTYFFIFLIFVLVGAAEAVKSPKFDKKMYFERFVKRYYYGVRSHKRQESKVKEALQEDVYWFGIYDALLRKYLCTTINNPPGYWDEDVQMCSVPSFKVVFRIAPPDLSELDCSKIGWIDKGTCCHPPESAFVLEDESTWRSFPRHKLGPNCLKAQKKGENIEYTALSFDENCTLVVHCSNPEPDDEIGWYDGKWAGYVMNYRGGGSCGNTGLCICPWDKTPTGSYTSIEDVAIFWNWGGNDFACPYIGRNVPQSELEKYLPTPGIVEYAKHYSVHRGLRGDFVINKVFGPLCVFSGRTLQVKRYKAGSCTIKVAVCKGGEDYRKVCEDAKRRNPEYVTSVGNDFCYITDEAYMKMNCIAHPEVTPCREGY